jgi:hypothetical protein
MMRLPWAEIRIFPASSSLIEAVFVGLVKGVTGMTVFTEISSQSWYDLVVESISIPIHSKKPFPFWAGLFDSPEWSVS